MSALPTIPESAPFNPEQRVWLNGFFAGLFSSAAPSSPPASSGPLLFVWGSQTGGAEMLAKTFAKRAAQAGFDCKALGFDDLVPEELANAKRVGIVTSTYGDGEMPDNAQGFWDKLKNGSAPRFDGLEYSVLALGDTNYVKFCEAGKRFDERLEELGARRIQTRTDCDVDFEKPSAEWFDGLLKAFGVQEPLASQLPSVVDSITHDKANPFRAALLANCTLNGPGSLKETRHIEIGLAGSGLSYEVGDALGVLPTNCPDFVSDILQASKLRGSEPVASANGLPLRLALQTRFDLTPFMTALPAPGMSADELTSSLRKLQPRLYSISSSPKAHPNEVHLTVSIVRYKINGIARKGVCSTFLADRSGGVVPVFIHSAPHFRLPSDPSVPVIMIGPGTGIAPFRAFLEEREATGASGSNWLFFGDQTSASDFLYQNQIETWKKQGTLSRLDTAFSRDQTEKLYVQHRMLEQAPQLWKWLQDGAYLYVCGDASRMAKDVDAALRTISVNTGGLSEDAATAYITSLRDEKRYQRDVY